MKKSVLALVLLFVLVSCGNREPQPIKLNVDSCDFCKMTIANAQFAAELITDKGRIYKFDDFTCMIQYTKENSTANNAKLFVNDYLTANKFIPVEQAFFLKGGTIHAPMGGKAVAFSNKADAQQYQPKLQAEAVNWKTLYNPN
ncbi:nitrous oxide reductase accessory protein NosL [Flavobacterium sp. XGLA_31]|uniref:nitrous oxide reductase accessory protein NosL n=1 Tax=Flavobacterium sp. XGLA_31 TaxID=3447666 RepID=UPI003F39F67B